MSPKTGTSMNADRWSPRYRRKRDATMRAEERLWASKSGPVVIYHVPPESLVDLQEGYHPGKAAGGSGSQRPAA